jgi:hypothetical protein
MNPDNKLSIEQAFAIDSPTVSFIAMDLTP